MNKTFFIFSTFLIAVLATVIVEPSVSSLIARNHPQIITSKVDSITVEKNLDNFSKDVDTILIGTVKSIGQAYKSTDGFIYTPFSISVERYLKNPQNPIELKFDVMGGKLGNTQIISEDGPEFTVGERVLLFLGKKTDGNLIVYAGSSGKYLLKNGIATGSDGEHISEADLIARILKNLPVTNKI